MSEETNGPEISVPSPEETAAAFSEEAKDPSINPAAAKGADDRREETAKSFGLETPPQKISGLPTTVKTEEQMEGSENRRSVSFRDTTTTALMDPNLYIQMKTLARDFIASKAIPKCWETEEQVLVALQTGVEMGMRPMEALNSLYVVNGAINVWGKATVRRLIEHGYKIEYSDETEVSCTATVTRGDEEYKETYQFKEAQDSGYTHDSSNRLKIGWKLGMNRRKKLRYGVLSLIISTYIPNVLGSAMGIAEVSEDMEFNTIESPESKSADRQAKISAAVTKNKQISGKKFKPQAVLPLVP